MINLETIEQPRSLALAARESLRRMLAADEVNRMTTEPVERELVRALSDVESVLCAFQRIENLYAEARALVARLDGVHLVQERAA